jgi:hypothetical protein
MPSISWGWEGTNAVYSEPGGDDEGHKLKDVDVDVVVCWLVQEVGDVEAIRFQLKGGDAPHEGEG